MSGCIAFVNEKGGTAKTTLAVHAAAFTAASGRKTLLLDMDPQGSAGKCLGVSLLDREPSIYEAMLSDTFPPREILKRTSTENLWLAPADQRLSDLTLNIASHPRRYAKLKNVTRHFSDFEFIFIDSPPSLGLLAINILMAASKVVVPVPVNFLGLHGCLRVLKTILRLCWELPKNRLDIEAFVPVMYQGTGRQKAFLERLRAHLGKQVSDAIIPLDANVDLAQGLGKTLFEIAPECPAAQAMSDLFEEVFPDKTGQKPPFGRPRGD
ncbi:MAG: ParA family protein [bacterium]|nr:ParA family protein [bacterium]